MARGANNPASDFRTVTAPSKLSGNARRCSSLCPDVGNGAQLFTEDGLKLVLSSTMQKHLSPDEREQWEAFLESLPSITAHSSSTGAR
jgi:hypothetical protein